MFIAAQGTIEILSDRDVSLATLGEGQAFGEMALLSGDTRSATARAATSAVLLELARVDFDLMLESDPQIATVVQN